MTSFSDAIANGFQTMLDAAGVTITYTRGSDTVEIQAVPGKTMFTSSSQMGFEVRSNSRDYIVRASDLILNEVVITPKRGDSITEGERKFNVMRPDGDANLFRYCDSGLGRIRIYTKEVGA